MVAQQLNLPVLDGDGMGRAFPELQMCSFFMNNIKATPTFLANNSGKTVTITETANQSIEEIARDITISFGSIAAIAIYLMNNAQTQKAVIPDTISQAINLGNAILTAQANNADPIQTLCDTMQAQVIATGTITDIEQKIENGFLKGTVTIQTTVQKICTIAYQNEYLMAYLNDQIVVTTPDIIAIIDSQSGLTITSENLKFGIHVAVIAIPSPAIWTTPQGLKLVGPQHFGYNTNYKSCKEHTES